MEHILYYNNWKKLFEQETHNSIEFVIKSGTDATRISDNTLHENHGFPLPEGSSKENRTNHIYSLSLNDAFYKVYGNAKIGTKLTDSPDQIIFDGKSLVSSGNLEILWNEQNASKIIQVSGNGALAITRIASIAEGKKIRKENSGILIITLNETENTSGKGRYGKFFSLEESGLSILALTSKINSLCLAAIKSICNDEAKKLLSKDVSNLIWDESTYANTAPFYINKKTETTTVKIYPENKAQNLELSKYFDKFSQKELLSPNSRLPNLKLKEIAKFLKSTFIDIGLLNLSNFLPKYLSSEFPELSKNIINGLNLSVKTNIDKIKTDYSEDRIAMTMSKAFMQDLGFKPTPDSVKVNKEEKTFAPGK